MKSSKIWKIIWIIGLYVILALVLYLVILYKVEWEHKDLNTYLYFYDCDNNLCTSTTVQDEYYSRFLCEKDICPYINSIIGKNVILKRNNVSWIFNYETGNIINNDYNQYKYLSNDIFIVTDKLNKQGLINLNGDILINPVYDYIDGYIADLVEYEVNNLHGVNTSLGNKKVDAIYEDIVLIDDKIYAGKKENLYHIYFYDDINYVSDEKYNFIYSHNNIIFAISNKKIDILDNNLKSTLLMKIDTFYDYVTEKERESLSIYSDDEYIYFKVFINQNEYKLYKYDIVSKKII